MYIWTSDSLYVEREELQIEIRKQKQKSMEANKILLTRLRVND